MNRNYFLLTKEEFWFLVAAQGADQVTGYRGIRPELDEDKMQHCMFSLERKKYLRTEEDGTVSIDERLDAWMFVVAHAQGHGRAVSEKGEELLLYFMGESIVSLTFAEDRIELLWIPFIHLAIGQISGLIRRGTGKHWTISAEHYADNTRNICKIETESDHVESIREIADIWIGLHGRVMREEAKVNESI